MCVGTRKPVHRRVRSNVGSCWEVDQRTFFMLKETDSWKSSAYLRDVATKGGVNDAQLPVALNPRTSDCLSVMKARAPRPLTRSVQATKEKFSCDTRVFWNRLLPQSFYDSTPCLLVRRVAFLQCFPSFGGRRGESDRYEQYSKTPPPPLPPTQHSPTTWLFSKRWRTRVLLYRSSGPSSVLHLFSSCSFFPFMPLGCAVCHLALFLNRAIRYKASCFKVSDTLVCFVMLWVARSMWCRMIGLLRFVVSVAVEQLSRITKLVGRNSIFHGRHLNSVKFTLEQPAKAQRGSRCIALLFLQPQH